MWNGQIRWLVVGVGMILGLLVGQPVDAAKSTAPSNEIGFSVAAKIPNNQIHKNNSFFDLKMDKNQRETLETVIYNTTNQDIQVETAIHTAYTNTNGVVEYVTPAKKYDRSLTYRMDELTKLTGHQTVTVPANGSTTIAAQVQMPKKAFNGVLMGGWYFKRVNSKVTGEVKGSMNIRNQYSYVIGLKYTSGTVPQPTMKLDSVGAGTINYHKGIMVTLRNPTAVMIPNLTTDTTITSKNSGKVVQKATKKGVQMAPNTFYKYPMLLGKTNLQAGRYHLKMIVKNQAHRWTFEKDFDITQQDAKKYNQLAVDNNGVSIWWLIGLGALGMLILVGLVLWIIWLVRKRRKKVN